MYIGRLIRQLWHLRRRILGSFTGLLLATGPANQRTCDIIMASAQTPQPTAGGEKVFAEVELVVICAVCGRTRSRDGLWIWPLPCPGSDLEQKSGRISHTYCPECLARHYPAS